MARPRTPTRLLELTGSFAKHPERRAARAQEPQPPTGAPAPRRKLAADVRRWYVRLARLADVQRVATRVDGVTLELAAMALADHDAARALVARDGPVYVTRTAAGSPMTRPNPAVAIASDAWKRALAALRGFGMDPASRAHVAAAPAPEPDDPCDAFLGRPPR
jgi:P27 family predicted phage terminase small subunit